jgi:WD40 repeat protein
MPYKAFISYSHAADGQFAPALQSALHKFARPFYMLRAIQVFRDRTDLSANPALWPVIEKALNESEYFLLLASPEAARSRWVKREIDHWLKRHDGAVDKLLIIWTDGKLVWDGEEGDFDWQNTDVLPKLLDWNKDDDSPKSLQKRFAEPFYIDGRWVKTEKDVSLRNPRFLNDIATLAATLHGKPKSEMIGEDVKQHKKYRRVRNATILLLLVLLIASTIAAIVAEINRKEAKRQTSFALSRQLAAQSKGYISNQFDLALLLAVEAYGIRPIVEARNSLLAALTLNPRLTTFLRGHQSPVYSLDFSPDDKMLVSGDADGQILFWDVATHQPLGVPLDNKASVSAIAFSPDGARIVSGGGHYAFTVWDVATRTALFRRTLLESAQDSADEDKARDADSSGITSMIQQIVFSPDGKRIAVLAYVGEEATITIWDVATGERIANVPDQEDGISIITFIRDSGKLAAFTDTTVYVWDDLKLKPRAYMKYYSPHAVLENDAAFSHDGKLLAVTDGEGIVDVWNTTDDLKAEPLKIPVSFTALGEELSFSWDNKMLAVAKSHPEGQSPSNIGEIVLLDVDAGEESSFPMTGHARDVAALAFNHKGDAMASGSFDKNIILWKTEEKPLLGWRLAERRSEIEGNQSDIKQVVFSPDGQRIAAYNSSGNALIWTALIWDVRQRQLLDKPQRAKINDAAIVFTDGGDPVVITSSDKTVTSTSRGTTHSLEVYSPYLVVSENGKVLAVWTSDDTLSVYDAVTLERKNAPTRGFENVGYVILSGDGKLLAGYKRKEQSVVVLSTETGAQLGSIKIEDSEPIHLAFSHDARTLAIGAQSENLILWDLLNFKQNSRALAQASRITSLAFSSDDQMLAASLKSGAIFLSDVSSGQTFDQPLRDSAAFAQSLAFSPDGKVMAAAYPDGKVILWDIDIQSWIDRARHIANRGFTSNESQQYVSIPQ